jgi:tetratricopeptide (TPR) repeat protein
VRNKCVRPCAVIGFLLLASVGGHAQKNSTVRGELSGSYSGSEFYVTLDEPAPSRGWKGSAEPSLGGRFEFQGVPYGAYRLRVVNGSGDIVREEFVTVTAGTSELNIWMPEARVERPAAGRVSMTQLRNPPTKKAVKAALEAERLSRAAKYDKAAEKLEEAIRESPYFAEAHSNLAAQRLRLKQYEEGLAETARAMEIAGPNPIDLTNSAYALWTFGDYSRALVAVREALRMDRSYARAHLVLGQMLAMWPANQAEALGHLDRAAEEFPSAAALAARVRAHLESERQGR